MAETDHLFWMNRCLELASMAEGHTSPNPMVGAVIVHNGLLIGEGYHIRAGEPHAEVIAVRSVTDRSLLGSSTLYVSLEPCSHQGRTPPCADMIIAAGIPKVVIGTTDTSLKVAGRGIARLRDAGVEVITGVAEEGCRWINRRFFSWHERGRPWVIMKWARSTDGFIDLVRQPGEPAEPHWITGMTERVLVHRWRAEEDAILAGGATIRADNPSLDTRYWKGKNPVRVIVSRSAGIDPGAAVFRPEGKVLIFTRNASAAFARAETVLLGDSMNTPSEILSVLHSMGIQSVLIEGGATIMKMFHEEGLWDEARRFTGKMKFGDGVADPFTGFIPSERVEFETSILETARNF